MPGALAATETTAFFQRLGAAAPVMPVDEERVADVRYEVMTSVPENWIPFVPVHVPGSNRQVQLPRSAMPRIMPGLATEPVQPRAALLREGRDGPGGAQPYFLFEEEVGRVGTVVTQSFQRTRALGGRAVLWVGAGRTVGHGEGSSGWPSTGSSHCPQRTDGPEWVHASGPRTAVRAFSP